jgi:hypothetical protein
MYMKTKETLTICPKKVGHLLLSFGHFRQTDADFAEIRGELNVKRRHLLTKSLLASSLAFAFDGGESPSARQASSPRSARRWCYRAKHIPPAPPCMTIGYPAVNAWAAILPEVNALKPVARRLLMYTSTFVL